MRERSLPIAGGTGTIACPLKGELAIERCRSWQRETAAAGASWRRSLPVWRQRQLAR